MQILQYRGISTLSRLIRFQTRSIYSHSAVWFPKNSTLIESWYEGGVVIRSSITGQDPFQHTPKTRIDVFEFYPDHADVFQEEGAYEFATQQVGKRYDFLGVFRFLTRRDHRAYDRWFCSELVSDICRAGGINLQNIPSAHTSPRDIAMSPRLRPVGFLRV